MSPFTPELPVWICASVGVAMPVTRIAKHSLGVAPGIRMTVAEPEPSRSPVLQVPVGLHSEPPFNTANSWVPWAEAPVEAKIVKPAMVAKAMARRPCGHDEPPLG